MVDVGAAFVAGAQAFEGVEPGEGAFDVPAVDAQAGPVLGAAAGDDRGDAQGADLDPVAVVVVAPVGVDPVGSLGRAARGPQIFGIASSRGRSWVTSLRLPPVRGTASGMPAASVIRWCLDPLRPRSTGLGPTWSPL